DIHQLMYINNEEIANDVLDLPRIRRGPRGCCNAEYVHGVARDHQYLSAGRISTAPPNRAAGIRAASAIADSMLSASYTEYPAAPSARYVPFLTWVFPSRTCTVLAASGSPNGSPGARPSVLLIS